MAEAEANIDFPPETEPERNAAEPQTEAAAYAATETNAACDERTVCEVEGAVVETEKGPTSSP